MHTAPYFAAIGILTIVLALQVIRLRWKFKVSLGDGGIAQLGVAIRVFGNFTEYAPIGLVLVAALEFVQAPVWYMHVTGMTLVLGRLLHAYGLPGKPINLGRASGITLTLVSIAFGSIGVMLFTLMA